MLRFAKGPVFFSFHSSPTSPSRRQNSPICGMDRQDQNFAKSKVFLACVLRCSEWPIDEGLGIIFRAALYEEKTMRTQKGKDHDQTRSSISCRGTRKTGSQTRL